MKSSLLTAAAAMAAFIALGSPPGFAAQRDSHKQKSATSADTPDSLITGFAQHQRSYYEQAAKWKFTGPEFKKLTTNRTAYQTAFAVKSIAVVERAPVSPRSVELLIQAMGADNSQSPRIYGILQSKFAKSPLIRFACSSLSYSKPSPECTKLLTMVSSTNPSEECRALAAYALGHQIKSSFGAYSSRKFTETERATAAEEAIGYFTEVMEKYPGVKSADFNENLAVVAKRQIEVVKNSSNLVVGKTAPVIEGSDLDGVPFKTSDYLGKVVVIDFWGNW